MPEGDTVWLVAKRLHEALSGDVLVRADLRVPAYANADLVGARVVETVARGKHLLTRLDDARTLHTHLRMDGMWHLYRPGTPWRGGPDHQVRVVLATGAWEAVGYRLPVVDLIATADEHTVVGHLGPDLLDPGFDRADALRRLAAEPDREIGVALLDQSAVAGIGNMYKDEVLFVRRTSPFARVADVEDLGALLDQAQRFLVRNKDHAAQVTTGDPRRGHEHWVYGRGGRPCRRCGARLHQARQGVPPRDRLTTWCPSCQPAAPP